MIDPTYAAMVRRLVELGGLYEFVQAFWPVVEACEFVPNWHLENVCKALEAVSREYECTQCGADVYAPQAHCPECGGPRMRRKHPRLVINQPPSTSKSVLVSVFWPAWHWTWDPTHRWMFTSFADKLVERDAGHALQILKSPLYRACWPETVLVGGDTANQALGKYATTAHGVRYSFSLQGGITGFHTDTLVIDDPIKPKDAEAATGAVLQAVEDIYRGTLTTRRRDPIRFAEVLIMQRLADGDLSKTMLDDPEAPAEHICYPMQFEPDCSWDRGNRMGLVDPRTEKGELLWPSRFPVEIVRADMAKFTAQHAAAQYQQNPTPETGAFFEAAWFREYTDLGRVDDRFVFMQSWDLGFKGRDRGSKQAVEARSRTHGALWAWHRTQKRLYLVAEVLGRWNYPEARRTFVECQSRELWNRAIVALVEDKAMGTDLISELRRDVPTIKPIDPEGSKEDRARRHSARAESGILYLPLQEQWAQDFRDELVRFPKQRENDRVDTTTQLLDFVFAPGGLAAQQWSQMRADRVADLCGG